MGNMVDVPYDRSQRPAKTIDRECSMLISVVGNLSDNGMNDGNVSREESSYIRNKQG